MHGTDVVFLGVSVDEAKDKQKWLDFIETEGLKGIQLLANGWSKITKDYKINGIPRFMVFDKKGNIVSADAPRPSNPELKKCWKRNSTDNPHPILSENQGLPCFTLFSSPLSRQYLSFPTYFQKLKSVQKNFIDIHFCFA